MTACALSFRRGAALLLCLLGLALLNGCASRASSTVYSRRQAQTLQTVHPGTVRDVRDVTIEGDRRGVGRLAGGVIGGVAGSRVGGGSARIITGAIGAVAGTVAGSAASERITRRPGLEITIDLDDGRTVAVVQDAAEVFVIGERVRVLEGPARGTARVTK